MGGSEGGRAESVSGSARARAIRGDTELGGRGGGGGRCWRGVCETMCVQCGVVERRCGLGWWGRAGGADCDVGGGGGGEGARFGETAVFDDFRCYPFGPARNSLTNNST